MKYVKIFEQYFDDLSPRHTKEDRFKDRFKDYVCIGWLDSKNDFPKGDVPREVIDKIKNMEPYIRTKGFHTCEFCTDSDDKRISRSSTEFKVEGNGKTYCFPQMLVHYITKHNYQPPQEFIDAVLDTDIKPKESLSRPFRRPSFKSFENTLPQISFEDAKNWIDSNYSDTKVMEMFDEEVSSGNWIDREQMEEEEYESEYDYYVDYGRGEAESAVIDQIISDMKSNFNLDFDVLGNDTDIYDYLKGKYDVLS
jgi:hypothetical protein